MAHDLTRLTSPEEEELGAKQVELNRLSDLLGEKELELRDLRLCLAKFQNRYFRRVGAKYTELDVLRARIAEAKSQQHPQDARLKEAANDARGQAERTAREYEGFRQNPESEEMPPVTEDITEFRIIQ
ncbi:MAG: hypothetical protein NTZ17_04490 [Phycisphaerae bacterium]|nr:hypothetical protein [Phycisphaerae bacterium]